MKIKSHYLTIMLILLFSYFSYCDTFMKLENYVEDYIFQEQHSADSEIIILGVDDKSLDEFGAFPWDRQVYADLINKLSLGNPSAIGIDLLFSNESNSPESDEALIEAIKKAGNVVLASYANIDSNSNDIRNIKAASLEEPMESLKAVSKSGFINVLTNEEDDQVIRKFMETITYNDEELKSFSYTIYKEALSNTSQEDPLPDGLKEQWKKNYIDFIGEPGTIEYHSIADVINDEIPTDYFENKIILIGPYTLGLQDRFTTSASRYNQMYGIEIHANLIQNYLNNNFKTAISPKINVLILLLLGLISYLAFKKLRQPKASILMFLFIGLYLFLVNTAYNNGIIIKIIYPLLLIVLINIMLIIYSYIEEYLKRRQVTDMFGKYVAPQVVEQILKGGQESLHLGGVRRMITALFVDIRGFTPLSEKAEPEEIVDILNDYLNLTAESIFKYEGTLDKFIGDATMAIYNAPIELEDHAYRAVQTAWAMKQGSYILQEKLEKKFGKGVQFGIGINTGYAVVGNIGAKFRMDYTAIGDTVNTAARLESNAKAGQIILSKSTYELVKDKVEVTPLGEIKVKGKEQGIEIYQLEKVI